MKLFDGKTGLPITVEQAEKIIENLKLMIEALSAEYAAMKAATCTWTYDNDPDMPFWSAACGLAWCTEDGTLADNEVLYCPKCGKRVLEVVPPEANDD